MCASLPERRLLQESSVVVVVSEYSYLWGVKNKTTYCGATILSPHPGDVSTCPEDCIERHPSHTETRKSEALSTKCWRDSAVFLKCALSPSRCSRAGRIHARGAALCVLRPSGDSVTGDSRCADARKDHRSEAKTTRESGIWHQRSYCLSVRGMAINRS